MTHRRDFLMQGGAAALLPFVPASAKAGKVYRVGLIGAGWWGMNLARVALSEGQCRFVAVCDPDADQRETAADELDGLTGVLPNSYADFREMLESEQLDIAIIASPDHWHALQTIAALRAGAHVFVEKPTGHTIGESRAMVDAAQETGRMVQVGLHRRIGPHHVSGMEFLKSGAVGDIGMVRMFVAGNGKPETPTANEDPPPELDWDLYCGPAPMRPYCRNIHPGRFRNYLDFANGTLGDWGVHWLDQLLWWSEEKWPKSVYSTGGRPVLGEAVLTDAEQTTDAPDHQSAVFEFEQFTATWEHRKFAGGGAEKTRIGAYFYGTKGTFHMGWRDGWTFYPSGRGESEVHEDPAFDHEKDGHNVPPLWRDFLDAIEKGRKPVADVEIGHQATNLSLLGMLSYKLGRSVRWDGETETFPGDAEANALLRREYRGEWVYPV
ncbi:MAG: Gfo/Idh/MocA family oxidoreductase [Verrucomicrobiota bacterium]